MNSAIRKDFVDTFNKLTHKLSPWEVWKDFVVMCSCSFSNALDKTHYAEREKMYMDTVKKYSSEEVSLIPQLLAYSNLHYKDFCQDTTIQRKLHNTSNLYAKEQFHHMVYLHRTWTCQQAAQANLYSL